MCIALILEHRNRWAVDEESNSSRTREQSFARLNYIRLEVYCDNEGMSSLTVVCGFRWKASEPYIVYQNKMLLPEGDGVDSV